VINKLNSINKRRERGREGGREIGRVQGGREGERERKERWGVRECERSVCV